MLPEFAENGQPRKHTLEELFKAPAWNILTAIEHGHRARTDVKGKLAEYYLNQYMHKRRDQIGIDSLLWSDATGQPDFIVEIAGKTHKIECKNIRSGDAIFRDGNFKVEIQKTRNAIAGGPSRGYKFDEFDILAACLFNQTGEWKFLFCSTVNLERQPKHPDYLVIFQKVPPTASGHWRENLEDAIGDSIGP